MSPESLADLPSDMDLLVEQGFFPERVVSYPNGTHVSFSGTLAG